MTTQYINDKEIFNAARRISDAAARENYLLAVCADDSETLIRVRELLELHEREQSFLESPAVAYAQTLASTSLAEEVGTIVGPYKLREQIGEGGFGVVFLAEQTNPVKRRVALKIIKPGMDTKEVITRFEAERQALALMDHPNIARVLDAGATESGRPYFVMELVKGISITEYCDQCHLSTHDRLQLFRQVCRAIQHAHQKGVIHRDVKPSNVLIAMQDGHPVPKVIDFGVAKAINQRLTENTLLTRFAQVVGTPLYMSPEQAEMSALDVDTRSDIYSLGVLLYELLTGTTPFERERLKEATFDEMRRIIREEEPLRPSARISTLGANVETVAERRRTDPRKLQQIVQGELDWIVLKALEKDRTRRYETASSLAEDIERYLGDEPVIACPPSAGYRLRKFARRNKLAIVSTSVVAASLVVLAIVASVAAVKFQNLAVDKAQLATDLQSALDNAQDNLSLANREANRAEAALVQVSTEQERAETALTFATAEQHRAEGNLDLALEALDAVYLDAIGTEKLLSDPMSQAQPSNPDLLSTARPLLTDLEKELLKRGLSFYDRFAQQNAATPRAFSQTAQAHYRVGLLQAALGDVDAARVAFQEAVERFEKLVESDSKNKTYLTRLANAYSGLANIEREWNNIRRYLEQAETAYSRAIAVAPDDPALHINRSRRRVLLNKYEEAAADIERAIELDKTNIEYLVAAANFYTHSREVWKPNTQRAVQYAERAVALDPNSESARDIAACVQAVLFHNRDAALKHIDAGLETTPDSQTLLTQRARIHILFEDYDAGLRDAERALEIDPERILASNLRATARLRIAQQTTDPDLARERFEQALAEFEELQEKAPHCAILYHFAGEILIHLERYDEAIIHLSKDIERRPSIQHSFKRRAVANFHLKEFDKALQDLRQAFRAEPQDLSTLVWIPPQQIAACPNEDFRQGVLKLADDAVANPDSNKSAAHCSRAALRLAFGQQKEALADFQAAIQLDPKNWRASYELGLAALYFGQPTVYRDTCRRMLEASMRTTDPGEAGFTGWTCALSPQALDDYTSVIGIVRKAHEATPEKDFTLKTFGAVLYRAGRYEDARTRLSEVAEKLEKPTRQQDSSPAYAWYFLAMTQHALENSEQATKWLARANEWTDEALTDADNPPAWNRRLTLELLRNEANRLIGAQEEE